EQVRLSGSRQVLQALGNPVPEEGIAVQPDERGSFTIAFLEALAAFPESLEFLGLPASLPGCTDSLDIRQMDYSPAEPKDALHVPLVLFPDRDADSASVLGDDGELL